VSALGVDIGGTWVRAGLVAVDGSIRGACRFPTPAGGEPPALAAVLRAALEAVARGAAAGLPATLPLGVALPGIRDARTGVLRRAVNLPRLEGTALPAFLEQALGRPARLETDVNAAGWAQWRAGAPRARRFVYVSVGTGVGACVILDGAILRHTNGGPGQLGFLIVDTSSAAMLDASGVRGCLQAMVCGASVTAAREAGGVDVVAGPLAVGLVQIAHIYEPEVIALGGGVIDAQPEIIAAARGRFEALRGSIIPPSTTIAPAALPSDQAGVVGAASLAAARGVDDVGRVREG
jgi:glucokinase